MPPPAPACERCPCIDGNPHPGLPHATPRRSKAPRQDRHPKLQQGGWQREAALCSCSGKLLPSTALQEAEDAAKHLLLPSDSSAWKSPVQVHAQDELLSLLSHASNALEVNKSPPRSCTISLPTPLGLEIPSQDPAAFPPCQST